MPDEQVPNKASVPVERRPLRVDGQPIPKDIADGPPGAFARYCGETDPAVLAILDAEEGASGHATETAAERVRCESIWHEVRNERIRAHDKHGDTSMEAQPVGALDRLLIVVEEVGEVAELFLAARHGPLDNRDHLVELLRSVVNVGQVAHRLNDQRHDGAAPWPTLPDVNTEALRKELIQVSAMAGAWADAIT